MPIKNRLFTVICRWNSGSDACEIGQLFAIVLRNDFDAKDAANEACLYLIWDKQGWTQPLFVIEGEAKLTLTDTAIFDAAEYDETITFARGKIVSCFELV
jgi:hypothetical protein